MLHLEQRQYASVSLWVDWLRSCLDFPLSTCRPSARHIQALLTCNTYSETVGCLLQRSEDMIRVEALSLSEKPMFCCHCNYKTFAAFWLWRGGTLTAPHINTDLEQQYLEPAPQLFLPPPHLCHISTTFTVCHQLFLDGADKPRYLDCGSEVLLTATGAAKHPAWRFMLSVRQGHGVWISWRREQIFPYHNIPQWCFVTLLCLSVVTSIEQDLFFCLFVFEKGYLPQWKPQTQLMDWNICCVMKSEEFPLFYLFNGLS